MKSVLDISFPYRRTSSVLALLLQCGCQSAPVETEASVDCGACDAWVECDGWACVLTGQIPPGYLQFYDGGGANCQPPPPTVETCYPPDPRASCNSWPCSPGDACENLNANRSWCTPLVEGDAEACGEIFCQNGCSCADAGANHCACTAP